MAKKVCDCRLSIKLFGMFPFTTMTGADQFTLQTLQISSAYKQIPTNPSLSAFQ
jgi:hypothetical protein